MNYLRHRVQLICERVQAIERGARPHHVEVEVRPEKNPRRRCEAGWRRRQFSSWRKEEPALLGILGVLGILGDGEVADNRAQRHSRDAFGFAEQYLYLGSRKSEPR